MLSKKAISAYLDRDFESFIWVKKAPFRELKEAVRDVLWGTSFRFITPPYHHQLVSFWVGCMYPQFLFYLDMGLGKSKIALDCFNFHRLDGLVNRLLVIVPNVVNVEGWIDQVEEHTNLRCVGLIGSGNDKWEQLGAAEATNVPIIIGTYDGLMRMLSNPLPKNNKKQKNKYILSKDKLEVLRGVVDAICMDEIHNVKNADTTSYQMCRHISKGFKLRYGLTGTPLGRNPVDLWAPYNLIDDGETFMGFNTFREIFFNQQLGNHGFKEWVFDKNLKADLKRAVRNRSLRYTDRECGDVPIFTDYRSHVIMSASAREYYDLFKGKVEKDLETGSIKKLEASFAGLRKLASGFISIKDDETGESTDIMLDDNKLQALKTLVQEMPPTAKMLVFYEFVISGRRICEMLEGIKVEYARASGDVKGAGKKIEDIKRFKNDPSCRILVANSKSGAEGGNFQLANYLVYYESPVSPITRRQSFKRVVRGYKKVRTYIYDLVTKDSVDEKILEYLKEGEDLFEQLINGTAIERLLK